MNEAKNHLIAVLDLTKAYNQVVRQLLKDKLEEMKLTQNLIDQIVILLLPLLVRTVGYVTHAVAFITTGLTRGGSTSTALFRILIDDLAWELRKSHGKD